MVGCWDGLHLGLEVGRQGDVWECDWVEHAPGCCKSFGFGVWWEVIEVEEFACVGGRIRGEARDAAEELAWVG